MLQKPSNPAAMVTRTGPGNVVSWQAIDHPRNTPLASEIQAIWLAHRFGLTGNRARLIASLAFREARQ